PAGGRCAAAAAPPAAAATTTAAGRRGRRAPAAARRRAGGRGSCVPRGRARAVPAVDAETVAAAAELRVQREQQLARCTVGAVNHEAPSEPVGLGADLGAMALDARLVVGAPGLGAACRHGAGAFRLDELDAARIREGLLGGIDHLAHLAPPTRRPTLR